MAADLAGGEDVEDREAEVWAAEGRPPTAPGDGRTGRDGIERGFAVDAELLLEAAAVLEAAALGEVEEAGDDALDGGQAARHAGSGGGAALLGDRLEKGLV